MAANPHQQQSNGLPILPLRNARFRNPPSSFSSARPNVPPELSPFGYMLMMDTTSGDLSPSLVSPSAANFAPAVSGQMRPIPPPPAQNATTLPLRNPSTPLQPSLQGPQMSASQPRPARLPQRTPSLGSSSDTSTASSLSSDSTDMASTPASSSTVKRKDIDGDCSICWEPFEHDQNELLYCKLTCGNNFHKKCFVEWLLTPKHQRTSPDLKCPYCRGAWDPVELRQLQMENGIIPPRPYKRPRPDFPARGLARDTMRRHYRERRQQLQREYQASASRPSGGDRYRPGVPIVQTSPNVEYGASLSMRTPPGAPPSTPQTSPPARREMYTHQAYPVPLASQYANVQRQAQMQSQFGPYLPYNMQPHVMAPMASSTQSHDLTAPGYNVPTFSPNPFLPPMPMPQQQHMPISQQRPISRCPAMQAQRMSNAPPPHGLNMPSPHFCPGMAPSSFEVQFNHFQYHAYYHFSGPPVP